MYIHAHAKHWKHINQSERLFLQEKFLISEHQDTQAGQIPFWQVLRDLGLAFFILVSFSLGLRALEYTLNQKRLEPVPAMLKQDSRTVWDQIQIIHSAQAASDDYVGVFDTQSHTIININPGKAFTYTIRFKNIGSKTWTNSGTMKLNVKAFSGNSPLHHSSWIDKQTSCLMFETKVAPGEIGTFKFVLQAPATPGLIDEKFVVVAGDSDMVMGTKFNIPFNVTNNTNANIQKNVVTVEASNNSQQATSNSQLTTNNTQPATDNLQLITNDQIADQQTEGDAPNTDISPIEESQPAYIENINTVEPQDVRVGLYSTTRSVEVTCDKTYYIQDGFGQIVEKLSANQSATVEFSFINKQYYLSVPGRNRISLSHLKFKSTESNPIFTILNYENRPSWNTSLNYNRFRNALEIRYAESTGRLWVINELPMEQYIAGIAETSDVSHLEYQKTMAIAARSYALYHYDRATKHAAENFTVDATYDQVYKGYTSETVLPRYTSAVHATAGQVVTYQNQPVVTPYFTQSDGRTRSWTEVWGGDTKAWLVSVSVPEDSGHELLGHGVGLSAWGALRMATYQGKTYDQILKYFYTGTEVKKIY